MSMYDAYKKAARLWKLGTGSCILNEKITFHRCIGSHDLWFYLEKRLPDGSVECVPYRCSLEGTPVRPLFEKDLPPLPCMQILAVDDVRKEIICRIAGEKYRFNPATGTRILLPPEPSGAVSVSPDGKAGIRLRDNDLFLERYDAQGHVESIRLTWDGSETNSYGILDPIDFRSYTDLDPKPRRPVGSWSPDSRYFVTFCSLTEGIRHISVTQNKPIDGGDPITFYDIQPFPGDEKVYQGVMLLCDAAAGSIQTVHSENDRPQMLLFSAMLSLSRVVWGEDSRTACFFTHDRFYRSWQARILDCKTGFARNVLEETYETFGFLDGYDTATYHGSTDFSLGYSSETQEIIWRSEAEGRSAFYLYDAASGALKNRITEPSYSARSIKYIDFTDRTLFCTISGEEEGVDPYLQRLYAFHLDTGAHTLLTPEIADHFATISHGAALIADTYSTVCTPPRTVLRDRSGRILQEIAVADVSTALEAGYTYPEPFQLLAADGVTKIYGILVKPADFKPDRKYPLVDYIYGGSSHINVPKAFAFSDCDITEPLSGMETLAQLGFATVIIDGLATPLREKQIHDRVYGRAWTCCGLEDHSAAIRQLSGRFPWIDRERVGIWGLSGGGYAAARALLDYPETYHVAVSVCGNHDMRAYRADYVERWMGPYDEDRYSKLPNASRAERLQGKLLLIHGDMDANVNVSEVLTFADALRAAGKEFSLKIIPNGPHTLAFYPEVIKMRWDFFVKNLLGQLPPEDFSLTEQ